MEYIRKDLKAERLQGPNEKSRVRRRPHKYILEVDESTATVGDGKNDGGARDGENRN